MLDFTKRLKRYRSAIVKKRFTVHFQGKVLNCLFIESSFILIIRKSLIKCNKSI